MASSPGFTPRAYRTRLIACLFFLPTRPFKRRQAWSGLVYSALSSATPSCFSSPRPHRLKINGNFAGMNRQAKTERRWNAIKRFWRHKYLWTTLFFIVVVGFVAPNSYWQRHELNKQRNELKREIKKYRDAYEREQAQINLLKNNPQNITRMARERYLMKRPNEDVYLIEKEESAD